MQHEEIITKGTRIVRKKSTKPVLHLAEKVRSFIRDSQVNFSSYFSRTEPELFDKILSKLESSGNVSAKDLLARIKVLVHSEKIFRIDELGLSKENWNRRRLSSIINSSSNDHHKLTIIESYLEVLESRNTERMSLAERLINFEKLLNEFLFDKVISINSDGLIIKSKNQTSDELDETQLSTGEYHLLYLTILALCTKVKGTVIAIDEPEMSMHVAWQRKLVKALLKISSKASPQMIFATHSPDIAANYKNSLKTVNYHD